MDREVSKEQQTRHIYDGRFMRSSIRTYSKLMLQACPNRWQIRQKPFEISLLQSITKIVEAVGIELLVALKTRKLLILCKGRTAENSKYAEPRYTAGTPAAAGPESSRLV